MTWHGRVPQHPVCEELVTLTRHTFQTSPPGLPACPSALAALPAPLTHAPVDALQVEGVGADTPHHRRVVSRVLAIRGAAVKGHAADAAHVVACRKAGRRPRRVGQRRVGHVRGECKECSVLLADATAGKMEESSVLKSKSAIPPDVAEHVGSGLLGLAARGWQRRRFPPAPAFHVQLATACHFLIFTSNVMGGGARLPCAQSEEL